MEETLRFPNFLYIQRLILKNEMYIFVFRLFSWYFLYNILFFLFFMLRSRVNSVLATCLKCSLGRILQGFKGNNRHSKCDLIVLWSYYSLHISTCFAIMKKNRQKKLLGVSLTTTVDPLIKQIIYAFIKFITFWRFLRGLYWRRLIKSLI